MQVQAARAVPWAGEAEFAVQAVHDASVDPPVPSRYLPAPHAVHDPSAVCPVAIPYLPAPQAVHDASAVCPIATPYLPAPQTVQSSVSAEDLYLPATHDVHDPLNASPP